MQTSAIVRFILPIHINTSTHQHINTSTRHLASLGVRVNAIVPGIMGTPKLLAMPEPLQQGLVGNIQFPKRMGKPAEFAGVCLHILENAFINGECIRLDGALRMSARQPYRFVGYQDVLNIRGLVEQPSSIAQHLLPVAPRQFIVYAGYVK